MTSNAELFNMLERNEVTPEEVFQWIRKQGGTITSKTKVALILKSLKHIEKRLEQINYFLGANPIIRIIEIRKEAQEILTQHGKDYETISKLFTPLAKEEKRMFKIAKMDTLKLINEKVELEVEQSGLRSELFHVELRTELKGGEE